MMLKIGYIQRNQHLDKPFKFREATYQRRITSCGDRVYSKMLQFPVDYEEIASDTKVVKENKKMMLVRTPLLLDEELRERMIAWVDWANEVGPKGYDPFYTEAQDG